MVDGEELDDGGGDELLKKVIVWAERSGRALELQTAQNFARAYASVSMSTPYVDPKSAATREADIVATYSWMSSIDAHPCTLSVVAECKSGRARPWVGLYENMFGPSRGGLIEDWIVSGHAGRVGVIENLAPAWIGEAPFTAARVASSVVSAELEKRKPGQDEERGVNTANDAIRQVLSASTSLTLAHLAEPQQTGLVVMALIVTPAPLFACGLAPDGQLSVTRVNGIDVLGHDPAGQTKRVYIRSPSSVSAFATELRARVKDVDGQPG
jgi:hypothetical protein